MSSSSSPQRIFLLEAHMGRPEAIEAAAHVCQYLSEQQTHVVMTRESYEEFKTCSQRTWSVAILDEDISLEDVELAVVVGGDGTMLRACETVRGFQIPLLGINLGHIGFLVQSEPDDLEHTLRRAIAREYEIDTRMTLDVHIEQGKEILVTSWALNDIVVEKEHGQRMMDVAIEIDGRPISSFGCDGVVASSPTGSTAYSFSAGGPIIWPTVEAFVFVPLNAHALFAKPLVIGSTSQLAIELHEHTRSAGELWCDGRRGFKVERGQRAVVKASSTPILLAKLREDSFTDRLVEKFSLPVTGWKGSLLHE